MKRGKAAKDGKKAKTPPISKDPKVFETAFRKRRRSDADSNADSANAQYGNGRNPRYFGA